MCFKWFSLPLSKIKVKYCNNIQAAYTWHDSISMKYPEQAYLETKEEWLARNGLIRRDSGFITNGF